MRVLLIIILLVGFTVLPYFASVSAEVKTEVGSMLSHDVYFTLKDSSAKAKSQLVAACKKYLSKHQGEVFFAAGARAEEFKRQVNDQGFDVALHIVFKTQADHDRYQDHPQHKKFIEENKGNWSSVRVFDSLVQ
jgi:hypothetical protein